jgi:hypothetical protein
MSGYAGNTSFEFEIERYKDHDTGELLASIKGTNQAEAIMEDDGFEYEYCPIVLQIEGRSYFAPGRLHGRPEDCYPDEGETEIMAVVGPDGKDWESQLTDEERDMIIEMIQGNVIDGLDGADPDDYYDDYE